MGAKTYVLVLRQFPQEGTEVEVRCGHWPQVGEEVPRSREEEEDGPDTCSLRAAWRHVRGWRFQPVVTFREARVRLQVVRRVGRAWIPFQEVDSQQLNSNGGVARGKHGLCAWTGGQVLGHMGKQELSYNSVTKTSIQQTSWKHLPLSSFNLCQVIKMQWEGRKRRYLGEYLKAHWGFTVFGTWIETLDFSLVSHFHS